VADGNAKPYEAFWTARNAAETGGEAEIDFVGYISEFSWIGDEITPRKFRDDLYSIGKGAAITIRMHSGGGEIFAASAIRAMLMEYPGKKTVIIEGLCASAAVAIALAGDEVRIYDTAYVMVHNPSYSFFGAQLDAETMDKFSNELRLFKEGILNAYETRTGLARDVLSGLMDAETWMTAQQAVSFGFANSVIDGGKPLKADNTVMNYANIPAALMVAAQDESNSDGQEPVSQTQPHEPAQAREQIANVQANRPVGGQHMNTRELLRARDELVTRATQLADLADGEARDFTSAERQEFQEILGAGDEVGKVAALDAQIALINDERARLKAAAESTLTASDKAEKNEMSDVVIKTMSRNAYNALMPAEQASFVRNGGRLTE
jgi:ATP-dependent Clp protease protease subunit